MSFVAAVLVAGSQPATPPVIVAPPRGPREPRTIVADAPPPIATIVDIEVSARSLPWKFTPAGEIQAPTGEVRKVSCIRNDARHFACSYEVRFAPYGETAFGDWIVRRKVYQLSPEGWLMLNAERWCSEIKRKPLPAYCYPSR
jgi:hypothetical protein